MNNLETRQDDTSSDSNALILVIDDNIADVQFLSMVLQKANYKVLTTSSGTEGLQIAKRVKPDLILLDLMISSGDGLEVFNHLKADQDLKQISVIFITTSCEDQHLEEALQLGAADCLNKPLQATELLTCINLHLELKRTRGLLETEIEAKSQFVANLSHEVGTSLNTMLRMTEFLLTTPLTKEQEECLSLIQNSGNNLLNFINDILEFSKSEAEERTLELHQFDLRELIADISKFHDREAANKGLVLQAHVDPNLAQFFISDRFQLRQIIDNLLINALKFTEEGQVKLRVLPLAKTSSESLPSAMPTVPLRFEIEDTGPGIAPEDHNQLFQPFSQLNTLTEGTGLGLAVCKQIVELMGGTIGVESQLGQGSTFWFEIELNPCYNSEMPELRGKRLLLVTPASPEMQAVVQQMETWGMVVKPVETLLICSTEISRGVLESQPYDLVLFNLTSFQRGTDAQLIQELCQHLDSTQTKTIGLDYPDKKHQRQQLGLHRFLPAPLQIWQLLSCLQNVFSPAQSQFQESQIAQLLEDVRVLAVDDSVISQQVLQRYIERLGGVADYGSNGSEALSYLNQKQYDVILMDCEMPTLDGYETTGQIRALSMEQPIIIGLTAHLGEAEQEKCLSAGMDDFITKPIQFEQFAQLLARWLLGDFASVNQESAVSSSAQEETEVDVSETEMLIDYEVLQQLTEGDLDLEKQLVSLYIDQARLNLQQGEQAVADQDAIALSSCAHKLKGSSVNIGMNLAAHLAMSLEQYADQANFQKATEILTRLQQVIAQVEQETF